MVGVRGRGKAARREVINIVGADWAKLPTEEHEGGGGDLDQL